MDNGVQSLEVDEDLASYDKDDGVQSLPEDELDEGFQSLPEDELDKGVLNLSLDEDSLHDEQVPSLSL